MICLMFNTYNMLRNVHINQIMTAHTTSCCLVKSILNCKLCLCNMYIISTPKWVSSPDHIPDMHLLSRFLYSPTDIIEITEHSCHILAYIDYTSYVPSREMRSSGKLILHQPIPNMETYGKRSFAYGGPRLWNNLDIKLRTIVSPETFKRELKTHLYKSVYTC